MSSATCGCARGATRVAPTGWPSTPKAACRACAAPSPRASTWSAWSGPRIATRTTTRRRWARCKRRRRRRPRPGATAPSARRSAPGARMRSLEARMSPTTAPARMTCSRRRAPLSGRLGRTRRSFAARTRPIRAVARSSWTVWSSPSRRCPRCATTCRSSRRTSASRRSASTSSRCATSASAARAKRGGALTRCPRATWSS